MGDLQKINLCRLDVRLVLITVILLTVIASRATWIDGINFDSDEVRTAQRAQGTVFQIIAWQPIDWPPLHNLLVGAWGSITSPHPKILRFSSLLIFLPSIALTYRFAREFFRNEQAAWGTTFAYATLGYSNFLGGYLRGYILALALTPLLFLLTLRYFEKRPRRRIGVYLGLTIAAMFYSTYAAFALFGVLGVYTIFKYRWQIWRWLPPALLSLVLVLPDMVYKSRFFVEKVENNSIRELWKMPPLSSLTLQIFQHFAGPMWFIWFILAFIAIILTVRHEHPLTLKSMWIFGTLIAAPLLLYIAYMLRVVRFDDVRYIYWGVYFMALLIGCGLAYVPRFIFYALAVVMLLLTPFPQMMRPDRRNTGFEHDMAKLGSLYMPGDVIVFDPAICFEPECNYNYTWDYYAEVFIGNNQIIVDEPGSNRRVWYVHRDEWEDMTLQAAARYGRIEVLSMELHSFMVTLYEGAPDPQGVAFENGLRFHGFDVFNREGLVERDRPEIWERSGVPVRLWWSLDHSLEQEYSVSLQLIDNAGNLIAQKDHAPQLIHLDKTNTLLFPPDMTKWQVGEYYVEERILELPNLQDPVYAQLYLVVYQWWDNQRLATEGVNEQLQLPLTEVLIIGY